MNESLSEMESVVINIAVNKKFQTSVVTVSLTKFCTNLSTSLATGSSSAGALIVGQV
jgi:hypothetical protein